METMETITKNINVRRMTPIHVATKEEANAKVMELIKSGESVGWGGSETLKECNIIESLRARDDITLHDRETGKTPNEMDQIMHDCLNGDVFLTSANAILVDGRIINVDGRGNRCAATVYGPKRVIFVIGKNKIVDGDLEAGINRVKNVASPPITKRLNKTTTGCFITGKCTDCRSDERICRSTVITEFGKKDKDAITVILVDEELGF